MKAVMKEVTKIGVSMQFASWRVDIFTRWASVFGLLVTVTALMTAAFPASAKEGTNIRERVMVFGDSLSAAYGIDVNDGWVSLMAARTWSGVTVCVPAAKAASRVLSA